MVSFIELMMNISTYRCVEVKCGLEEQPRRKETVLGVRGVLSGLSSCVSLLGCLQAKVPRPGGSSPCPLPRAPSPARRLSELIRIGDSC